jgi:hypothetical protein
VVAFGLLVLTGIVAVNSLNVVQRVTFIDHMRGVVEAKEPDRRDFRPLTGEARVLAGTELRTSKESGALLHWADGSRLEAGANTTLTVLQCRLDKRTKSSVSLFKLDVGQIFVHVMKALSASSKFEVRTPTATAGVRGTEFSVRVTPGGATDVLVYEGNVAVTSGGKQLGVAQGQVCSVAPAGSATGLRELRDGERKAWKQSTAAGE